MRRAEAEGGYAAVLAKGDPTAGAVLVILAERGRKLRIMERILQPKGDYAWQEAVGEAAENDDEFEMFLTRRQKFDPVNLVLELELASAERFDGGLEDRKSDH